MRQGTVFFLTILISGAAALLPLSIGKGAAIARVTGLGVFIVMFPLLFVLNIFILKWRQHGQDMQQEEKYESEGGFITLHAKGEGNNLADKSKKEKRTSERKYEYAITRAAILR